MEVSPRQGINALITVLSLAEEFEQWSLFKEVLRYVSEAGGKVHRLGPSEYLIEVPYS